MAPRISTLPGKVALVLGLGCLWGAQGLKAEALNTTTLCNRALHTKNSVHGLWTPVQHYRGKTFFVAPDENLRPAVSEMDDATGEVTTVFIDPNPDFIAYADGHNRFTMGIDPNGFIHIIGNMHGYAEFSSITFVKRYQFQNMLYWRSNKSLDVTGGFTFTGGADAASHLPGVEWGGDSRMFNDRNGVLYYSSRVRAFMGSRLSGSEPFIAYGLYRYDHTTGIWTALGGTVESAVPDAFNFNKVLYWDHTTSFEAFQTSPRFDTQNRLHFVISGHTDDISDATQIYARSDDQGKTWKKADDTVIPGLPLRAKKGERDQGQVLIVTRENGMSGVKIDKDGKIATMIHYVWNTWNGTAWVPIKGGAGILGPDGMMTGEDGGAAITRMAGIDQPITAYEVELNFNSFSELGLQTAGALYGVGLTRGTGADTATQMWVTKAVFGPAENIARNGTATASSSKNPAAEAFDARECTQWSSTAAAPAWVQYTLSSKASKAVTRYDLTSATDLPQCDPKNWEFQGSTDGTTWVTLDSRRNQSFLRRNQTISYAIDQRGEYSSFRLNVLATQGAARGVQLAELKVLSVDASVKPSAPKIFFSQNDNGNVWLSWTQPDHAATYTVKRARAVTGPYTVLAKALTDPADFCDSTGVKGTPYYYVVSAVNSAGQSPDSAPVKVTPQWMAPLPPLIVTATGQNQNIVLTWLPLWPHAASYTIKRSATPGGPYAVIAKGVPGLTFTDIKLANGKPYYYVVSASNEVCGESANSREIKGTPFRWKRLLQYKSLDTEDTGTVSASAENPPNEGAARAFDGDRGKWLFSASSAWLQYKFADKPGPAVTHYGMYSCYDYTERDPKDWELLGSHDGETWETLDVQKNQTFDEQHRLAEHCPRLEDIAKQAAVEPNTYSFENPKCYQYYRLNITKTRGGGLGSLIELVLWADGDVYKTPPPFTPFPSAELKTPASVTPPLVRK